MAALLSVAADGPTLSLRMLEEALKTEVRHALLNEVLAQRALCPNAQGAIHR